jgi:hydroxymethylglutaryl-CoA reductase
MNSRIPGFGRLDPDRRRLVIEERLGLEAGALAAYADVRPADMSLLGLRSECVIGSLILPLSVAPNFRVDDEDTLVPMVTEEPSVVAAASRGGLLLREGVGIQTLVPPRRIAGQVQLSEVPADDREAAIRAIEACCEEFSLAARTAHLAWAGGGGDLTGIKVYEVESDLVVLLTIDPGKSMGANLVTDICERLALRLEELSGGLAGLRIVTNACEGPPVLATGMVEVRRLHKDRARADAIARGVEAASSLAQSDTRRAVTHNKGIFNGIDAVLMACGQDFRAVEAAGHAFAASSGRYGPLAVWRLEGEVLTGRLEIPMAVGTVGGAVEGRDAVRLAFRVLGIESSRDPVRLAAVTAACGLAQNLAALTSLAGDGLLKGHMQLHARNMALDAGATPAEVDALTLILRDEGGGVDRARVSSALASIRSGNRRRDGQEV